MSDTPNFRAEIGRRIAVRRRELGITQQELGDALGLSRSLISQVESGRLEINAGDLPILCVTLRVPVSYFFDGLVAEASDEPVLEAVRRLSTVAQGHLSPEESLLLENYRAMDDQSTLLVRELAGKLANATTLDQIAIKYLYRKEPAEVEK